MLSTWKMPEYLRLDQVRRDFNQNFDRLYIEPLGENRRTEGVELIMKVILTDDPIIRALGFPSDPTSVASLRWWIDQLLSQKIAFGCFLKPRRVEVVHADPKMGTDEDILIAVDLLYVRTKRDDFPDISGENGYSFNNFMKYIKMVERCIHYSNLAQKSMKYLTSLGIFVCNESFRRGVEDNMMSIRKRISKTLRINIIASVFTRNSVTKGYKHLIKELKEQDFVRNEINLTSVCPVLIVIRGRVYNHTRDVWEVVELSDSESESEDVELSDSESESEVVELYDSESESERNNAALNKRLRALDD